MEYIKEIFLPIISCLTIFGFHYSASEMAAAENVWDIAKYKKFDRLCKILIVLQIVSLVGMLVPTP